MPLPIVGCGLEAREASIMSRVTLAATVIGSLLAVLLHAAPAQAANVRSWVASNGSGSACTRLAPCATFAIAAGQTDPGGVINCVDASDYGSVTIFTALAIDCTGTF